MDTPEAAVAEPIPYPRSLLIATGSIALTGLLGDFLFWHSQPGVSLGIFIALLAIGLVLLGERTARGLIALALLFLCVVQSGIELCFTNITLMLVLLMCVFGESVYSQLPGIWARWSEALYAAMRGPLRWSALLVEWAHSRFVTAGSQHLRSPTIAMFIVAIAPAAAIALIFAILLSSGNAILAQLVTRLANACATWLLDLSIPRTFLLVFWLTVGVAFFYPCSAPDRPRWWTRAIPLWNRREPGLALWQSIILLVVVNLLFFGANTADAIFLWRHAKLPEGVTYSEFVHQGVYSLIGAVVLAAGVLTIAFQQQPSISRSPVLRGLAFAWILQNIALIGGVLRRLQLYVETYQFSELRVYVGCFLLLVTIGFLLLAWHIHRGMKLELLLGSNVLATLTLFFILQFCDVGTWVGHWNVVQWKANSSRTLDVSYLVSLGPRGWPALNEVAQDHRGLGQSAEAQRMLRIAVSQQMPAAKERDWRAYQHRRDSRLEWLFRSYEPL